MKKIITLILLFTLSSTTLASTIELKLNSAMSNIANAIDELSLLNNSVIKIGVDDYISNMDVEESMESMATSEGIRAVGTLPISEIVELQTGVRQRFYKVYQYLMPIHSVALVTYNPKFSLLSPIRIYLIEDSTGRRWVYTQNIDSIISPNQRLPADISDIIVDMKRIINSIISAGASGDL